MSDNLLSGSDLEQAMRRAVAGRDESLRLAAVNGADLLMLAQFADRSDVPTELLAEEQIEFFLSQVGETDAAELDRLRGLLRTTFADSEASHG